MEKMNWYTCKEPVSCGSLLYSLPGSRLHPAGKKEEKNESCSAFNALYVDFLKNL